MRIFIRASFSIDFGVKVRYHFGVPYLFCFAAKIITDFALVWLFFKMYVKLGIRNLNTA